MENLDQKLPNSKSQPTTESAPTSSQPLPNSNAFRSDEDNVPEKGPEHNHVLDENFENRENQRLSNLVPEESSSLSDTEELELEILSNEQTLRSKRKESRSYLILAIVLGIVAAGFYAWAFQANGTVLWVLSVGFTLLAILMFIATLGSRLNEEKLSTQIEVLKAKRRILSRFDVQSVKNVEPTTSSYFDRLVRINIENLAEYYSLIKIHTNNSFRISVFSGIVGFLLIILGLITGFINVSENQYLAYIITGSGVLIEFVSGIFFYLYNRTVRELKGYHDSLLVVQNILLSFKIIEEITDDHQKSSMIGKMLEFLMTSQLVKGPIQNPND